MMVPDSKARCESSIADLANIMVCIENSALLAEWNTILLH